MKRAKAVNASAEERLFPRSRYAPNVSMGIMVGIAVTKITVEREREKEREI